MTGHVWPVDGTYSARQRRQVASAMMALGSAGRLLGARSGVRIGTPASTVTVSGSTWTCQPHAGVIDRHTAVDTGPYEYAVTAAESGTVAPAHATLTRVDTVVVRVDDPAEDPSTSPGLVVELVQGTAGQPAPAAPDRAVALAWLTRASAAAGGAVSVQWVAPVTAAAGGIIPVRSAAERDLITWGSPMSPAIVYRADTDIIERNVTGSPSGWDYVAGGTPSVSSSAWNVANTFTNTTPGTDPGSVFAWTPPRSGIARAVLTMDVQQATAGYVLFAITPRVNGGAASRTHNYFGPARQEVVVVCDAFRVRAGEGVSLDAQVGVHSAAGSVLRNGGAWRVTVD